MSDRKSAKRAETGGTEITRFNALRHGLLSRYTVLPWENAAEYHALVAALVAEHAPQGRSKSKRRFAWPAFRAASAGLGLFSFARVSRTGAPAGGGSRSFMARASIFPAAIVTVWRMRARARAHRTDPSGARTRSENASAAIPEWRPSFRRGPRACGGEPMSVYASKPTALKGAPMKPWRFGPNDCWRGPTNARAKGAFGDERQKERQARGDWRHRDHAIQCAAAWPVVALHRAALGERGRIPRLGRRARRRTCAAGTDRRAFGRGSGRHPLAKAASAAGGGRCPSSGARRSPCAEKRHGEGGGGSSRRDRRILGRRGGHPR